MCVYVCVCVCSDNELSTFTRSLTHTYHQAILFKGKQLGSGESLSSAGVNEGDTLNIVPTKGEAAAAAAKPRPVRTCLRVRARLIGEWLRTRVKQLNPSTHLSCRRLP